MTKYEVCSAIGQKLSKTTKDVEPIVEAFMHVVKKSMCEGENIYLRGFGTLYIKKRAEKPAWIISRKERAVKKRIVVPAHNIVKFKPAKTFKEKLKKSVPVK